MTKHAPRLWSFLTIVLHKHSTIPCDFRQIGVKYNVSQEYIVQSFAVHSTQEILLVCYITCDLGNKSLSGAAHAFEVHSGFWQVKASHAACVILESGKLHHHKMLSGGHTLFSQGRKLDTRRVLIVFNNPKLPRSVG